ncbi:MULTISPECIES: hypothetical protein [unclassified Rhodococcus (in: high G+C Gram-positive bacteria)]|nr:MULTISPECIES: hypothetical protein [unclassified Rhodococcus (in: high G+C Gram-positive bacteria)]MCC4303993.1 hypothetical protein [Rhodococcus sp. 3-2]
MAIIRNSTYVESVEIYISSNEDWMTDSESPLITSLFKAAEVLDKRTTASLLGEFRQIMRELHRRKPGVPLAEKLDEFDEMMLNFK